jgi:hypothetical protein
MHKFFLHPFPFAGLVVGSKSQDFSAASGRPASPLPPGRGAGLGSHARALIIFPHSCSLGRRVVGLEWGVTITRNLARSSARSWIGSATHGASVASWRQAKPRPSIDFKEKTVGRRLLQLLYAEHAAPKSKK